MYIGVASYESILTAIIIYATEYVKSFGCYFFGRVLYFNGILWYQNYNNDNNSDNHIFYTGLDKKFLFKLYGNIFGLPLSLQKQTLSLTFWYN